MKRWQDRGEVEDSEDDELSLELESHSPERPRKRAKHGQEPESAPNQPIVLIPKPPNLSDFENADDPDWIQPKVAKTYSRKTKVLHNAVLESEEGEPTLEPLEKGENAGGEAGGVEPAQSVETSGMASHRPSQDEQNTLPSSSIELPDLNTIFGAIQPEDGTQPMSAASSPLSEREVSPPIDFQFPELPRALPGETEALPASPVPAIEDILSDDQLPHSTAIARRNLRARKAIQLNPYQYDRAQYLKLCRARGVRPVRLEEQEKAQQPESQSQTASSQVQDRSSAPSSPKTTQEQTQTRDFNRQGLDYFDAGSSSDAEPGQSHRLSKRRKLAHGSGKGRNTSSGSHNPTQAATSWSQLDEFSVPPSPPRTTSDLSNEEEAEPLFRQTISGFRVPIGLTPAPLPTPQISSDVKRNDSEDSDSPPRRSRPSTTRRHVRNISAISVSSDPDTESDAESELEARRLRREQKRIKGVLPASWLKIDLQAQQARQTKEKLTARRLSATSPTKQEAQRGVARKISRPTQRDQSPDQLGLPGATSDSDDGADATNTIRQQMRLDLNSDRFTIAPSTTVDDDLMEDDFIDPMLAGSSRQRKSKGHRKHQPRITEALRSSASHRNDFSEERRANRVSEGSVNRSHTSKGGKARRSQRRPVVHLSIADAPSSPTQRQPQFLKLALRQTRQAPDRGRHSPTHKVIRLATASDTEEASSVLRAWREGTIAPCRSQEDFTGEHDLHKPSHDADEYPEMEDAPPPQHQQHFATPTIRRRKPTTGVSQPARQRRLQQTRLQPVKLQIETDNLRPEEHGNDARLPPPRRKPRPERPQRLREAQLETLERDFDQNHREAMFERRMQCMTESVARAPRQPRGTGFQLDRFLREDSIAVSEGQPTQAGPISRNATDRPNRNTFNLAHRPRKSTARRLDVETRQYRQPSEPLPEDFEESGPVQFDVANGSAQPVLQGLHAFGTRYPTDFDIKPLEDGTFFHVSTFIGSGDFKDALDLRSRDLDRETGHVRIYFNGEVFEWGAWNEDVAAQVARIPTLISDVLHACDDPNADIDIAAQLNAMEHNVGYLLRSVVRYCSKCIWFTDSVDRQSCVESLNGCIGALSDVLTDQSLRNARLWKAVNLAIQHQVVIAKQVVLLGDHSAVSAESKGRATELLSHSSRCLVRHGISGRFADIRAFYEENRRIAVREAGIQDESSAFACLVLLRNILSDGSGQATSFWQIVSEALDTAIGSTCNIKVFEQLWQNVFTILPAVEIDAMGITRSGSRFTANADDWSLIKAVVSRVLELYEPSSQIRGYSVNEYVRVTLTRCHCLINKWGWWRCEPVLNTVFDFFARRSFNVLHKEESRGSPKFLEELNLPEDQLEVMPDDCSFHVFLKMLTTSVMGMRRHNLFADRKIQRILWRFIPNHSRVYRKDSDLHKTDLEALRNQHDLFSILYYVSPPKARIGVDLVLGLVDHSTSHREACRLSVRAWANIASYQASTPEPVEALQELTEWFCGMMKTTLAQYRLAKSEAEHDFERAEQQMQHGGERTIDQAMLESTIASNQRQIAAIVVDALAGLKRTIRSANHLGKVRTLIEQTCFWAVFDLFDPSQRRLLSAMQEALSVSEAALEMQDRFKAVATTQSGNEDSQDFGDSSALEAFAADDEAFERSSITVADALLQPVGQFLSNVFGADAAPEDTLLQQVIDVWTHLASLTVYGSLKSWSSYVDDYGTTAWSQLRDTAQKRKFTPYFMSRILVRSDGHEEVRESVIMAWLLSLVEREAMLKFQHCLTSGLLNHCGDDPLLDNLPFTKDRSSGLYNITLADFRQRRVALISCLLCNMRTHYDESSRAWPSLAQDLRSKYASMLRHLMQAMKANYQELQAGHGHSVADASVQGGYVDFVQQVVSFLQQYALGICQVDRFFTDSAAFPLPVTDPTYVVGRLRSYIPKLAENSGRTQLAMFIQTVSERAAIDNQQQYLANQMATAMDDTDEEGDERSPTLRHVLLSSIFPAYIAKAVSSACGWIPTLPILQACEVVIGNLLYNVQIEEEQAVLAVVDTIANILHGLCLQCDYVLVHADILESPSILATLSSMFSVGNACLTITSYLQRATSLGKELSKRVQTLQKQAVALEARLQDQTDTAFLDIPDCGPEPTTPWLDTRAAADKQVREAMNGKWRAVEGQYYIQRGNTMKEVVVELGDSKDEKTRLLQVIASFCSAFEATFGDPHRKRRTTACDDLLGGVLV